jgi:hypothetical protein
MNLKLYNELREKMRNEKDPVKRAYLARGCREARGHGRLFDNGGSSASPSKPEPVQDFSRFTAQFKSFKSEDDWMNDFWKRYDAAGTVEEFLALSKELQAFSHTQSSAWKR